MKVYKVRGPLGCGKTEFLSQRAEHLARSFGSENIMYIAYTRGARKALSERLHKKLGLPCTHTEEKPNCEHFPWVSTIHSIASRLIGFKRENRVTRKHKKKYAETTSFSYSEHEDSEEEREVLGESTFQLAEKPPANAMFAIINNCNMREVPLKEWRTIMSSSDLLGINIDTDNLLNFAGGWEKFKASEKIMDYDDVLLAALKAKPPIGPRFMFVDEFQDLAPLTYSVYDYWKKGMELEEVYFAGDEHQTIYGFVGADVAGFLNEPYDELIELKINYRCYQTIWELAKKIVKPVAMYDVEPFTANNPGGEIIHHFGFGSNIEKLLPRKEDKLTIYLAETNKMANDLDQALINKAIPIRYTNITGAVSDNFRNAINTHHKIRPRMKTTEDETIAINKKELMDYLSFIPAKMFLKRGIKAKFESGEYGTLMSNGWGLGEVLTLFAPLYRPSSPENWKLLSDHLKLSDLQRIFFEKNSGVLVGDISALVGTAHSGKGMTADRVILINAMPKPVERIWGDSDTEREKRFLYHMAVGRATKRLDIVHGMGTPYPFLIP